ncbi:hypothetical protein MOQ72_29135 [Saccharopolyspora sp. K220]|uniref:hypothetical protein n=1 Tax=Saccharopolyspora soli TaxID=2926618 RepID=UPI001F55C75E|nr:hypothetical protein [Saccharopolyspora soli]MCI2421506.1 hypothetical protein [Saccharopolyspora soli]
MSQRLDRLVGPVVVRTVTEEAHDGGHSEVFLELFPVRSITAVVEFADGTAVPLAAETHTDRPAAAYLAGRYKPDRSLMSQRLWRRSGGADAVFAAGRSNIVVSYEAGRFDSTDDVAQKYKNAAELILINLWRSQQDSVGAVSEYDVPASSFPAFAVPRAARDMLLGEIQESRVMLA